MAERPVVLPPCRHEGVGQMLRKRSFDMEYVLRRAAHAEEAAKNATSNEQRETWLAVERGWRKLAQSCDLTDRIGDLIEDHERSRHTGPLPKRNEIVQRKA